MGTNASLLVVENEEDIRDMLCERFSSEGVEAVCAASCAEALGELKAGGFRAVVMDLGMSPVDGLTCAGNVLTLFPGLRLYAYTGYAGVVSPGRLREAGFHGCYTKGTDEAAMVREVAAYLLDGGGQVD